MSKEQKKKDNPEAKSHKPSNIEDFVCQMLERLKGTLEDLNHSKGTPMLGLPNPIGSETEGVIEEMSHDEPITKFRKLIVVPIPHGGEDKIKGVLNRLMEAREADINQGVREIFASVRHAKSSGEPAYQMQALKKLDGLINEVDANTRVELASVKKLVLAGESNDMDAASFRLCNVFANRVGSQNVRLAYTTLATQFGEGYQLCPKAAHQIGRALPMEISKCRDNCIDSRVTRDGAVTCAYADWLRKAADNHEAVEARLERVKHNLNGDTLGKLHQPDPIKSWEGQLDEQRDKYNEPEDKSMETSFSTMETGQFGHQGDVLKRIQDILEQKQNGVGETREEALDDDRTDDYDDETLEQMLEDEREPMNENELDMMIEELLADSREKE